MINDEFIRQSERILPTQAEYAVVMGDVSAVLGIAEDPLREESTFGRDFFRVRREDPMHLNPLPVDPLDLSDDDFANVAKRFGPDVYRVRAIPSSLLQTPREFEVLPAGGSCAIETWGLRMINYLKSRRSEGHVVDEDIAATATALLEMGPTISHVSGALLSGAGKDNVHYVESKLWTQTVAALGVADAEVRVKALYERINMAVARRAALINSETVMHFVDFDELDLPDGVRKLMADLNIEYDGTFGTAEVLYTYVGPDLLSRVQGALDAQVVEGKSSGLQGDYSVIGRFKQVDHNTWDSMDLPFDVIRGERDMSFEELVRADESYPFKFGVALGQHVVATEGDIHARNAVVAGFMDTPHAGELMHMQPNLRSADRLSGNLDADGIHETVSRILTDPRRLHHGNVEQHLAYLELFMADDVHAMRQVLAERKQAITAELKPLHTRKTHLDGVLQKNPVIIEQAVKKSLNASHLAQYVLDVSSQENSHVAETEKDQGILALLSRMNSLWKPIDERRKAGEVMTEHDQADIAELEGLFDAAFTVVLERAPQFTTMLETYKDRIDRNLESARGQIRAVNQEIADLIEPYKEGELPDKVQSKIDYKKSGIVMKLAEASDLEAAEGFVAAILTGENAKDLSKAELLRGMRSIVERTLSSTGVDNEEKQDFRVAIDSGLRTGAGFSTRLLTQFNEEAQRIAKETSQRVRDLTIEVEAAHIEHDVLLEDIRPLKNEYNAVGIQLSDIPKPFPLSENLFVSHALHFLWDEDFRLFIKDMRIIKESDLPKHETEQAAREAMRRIYPKLREYYLFIFGRTDVKPSTSGIYQRAVI